MRKTVILVLVGVVVALVAAGCKSQPTMSENPATGNYEEPLWVTKGVNAFPEDAGKAFYGVGIAEAKIVPRLALRRTSARENAKSELAGQLRTMVQSVYKDYSEAAFTPSSDVAESSSLIEFVQKSIIDETLVGASVYNEWTNPQTQDHYVLVRLSMDSVAQQLRDKIIEVEKDRLRKDAETAHQELDQIIEKNRNQLKF